MTNADRAADWEPVEVRPPEPLLGDAFGETLLATLEAGAVPGAENEIIERDDGFIVAMDAARYFRSAELWSPPVRWAVKQAHGRVLDVGLGAGQHALVVQEMGCDVTGLEISPGALEVSRRRGVHKLVSGSIYHADQLFEPGSFDCVLLFGQNLALLGSAERAGKVFRQLHDITAPGAVIIGDNRDPSHNPEAHRDYYKFNRSRGRWIGHFTLRWRHREVACPWFDYLFCTPDELADLGEPNGWRIKDVQIKGATYAVVMQRVLT